MAGRGDTGALVRDLLRESGLEHAVAWTGLAVAWLLLGIGFLLLDRPLIGLGHVLLGVGGLWRARNPRE